ncbi:hypothetical protein L484_009846 [Morus notabilis]|uniref:Uncharacterized protein n=1 Tax=Morus notabilis TaxID=981085 RepID=W9QWY8_9ROSA|nr:hypothetical protein L484_009846 [Morus notabilis]
MMMSATSPEDARTRISTTLQLVEKFVNRLHLERALEEGEKDLDAAIKTLSDLLQSTEENSHNAALAVGENDGEVAFSENPSPPPNVPIHRAGCKSACFYNT